MCINTSFGCIVNKSVIFWQDYSYRFFDISESTIANEAQSLPKLAVFGFGAARLRYPEARDATLKAIKLPSTLKNLKPQHSIGDKKYAFSKEFLRQYYDETFKQRITCQPTNNREGYAQQLRIPRKWILWKSRGNKRFCPFRGRGRGTWSQYVQPNRSFTLPNNTQ